MKNELPTIYNTIYDIKSLNHLYCEIEYLSSRLNGLLSCAVKDNLIGPAGIKYIKKITDLDVLEKKVKENGN